MGARRRRRGTPERLNELLVAVDVLLISAPLTRATYGLIGAAELGRMKDDAILVNLARGEIVQERPLYDHLVSRTASENTAPVPFESAYAIWTSWQHSCDRDDQALMQRGDRVGNVTLGPDRRRRGVGNYREWQVF